MKIGAEFERAMTYGRKRLDIRHRRRDAFPLEIGAYTRIECGDYSDMHLITGGVPIEIEPDGEIVEVMPDGRRICTPNEHIPLLCQRMGFSLTSELRGWLTRSRLLGNEMTSAWLIAWC